MTGHIFKGVLFPLFFLSLSEVLVCGAASEETTDGNCGAVCQLLRTLVYEIEGLDRKINLLLGLDSNCSYGRHLASFLRFRQSEDMAKN